MARAAISVVFAVKDNTVNTVPVTGWTPEANNGYSGSAVITSITANAPDNENATYSITLEGSGALTKIVA